MRWEDDEMRGGGRDGKNVYKEVKVLEHPRELHRPVVLQEDVHANWGISLIQYDCRNE